MKNKGSQSEILIHEILNIQKILVGWKNVFPFSTEIWAEQLKNHPVEEHLLEQFNFFSTNLENLSRRIFDGEAVAVVRKLS